MSDNVNLPAGTDSIECDCCGADVPTLRTLEEFEFSFDDWKSRVKHITELARSYGDVPEPEVLAAFLVSVNMYLEMKDKVRKAAIIQSSAPVEKPPIRGHVYFIQAKTGGPIKIGTSANPEKRLKSFNHPDLRILATIPGDREKETEIHRKFEHLRTEREWFDPAPELLQFITEIIGE